MPVMQLSVPEIHCDHCKTSIEGAVGGLAGVAEVAVDIDARTVTVEYADGLVGRDQVVGAIEDQGYHVPA